MESPAQAYLLMAGMIVLAVAMVAGAGWVAKFRSPWVLREASRRLRGRIIPGGWARAPESELNHEGIACRFSVPDPRSYQFGPTRLRLQRPCPGRLRASHENALWKVRKLFGAQDFMIGDPEFDSAFMVQCEDRNWARKILTPEVRTAIVNVARIERVTLDLGPAGIAMRTWHAFRDEPERLTAFVRAALALGTAINGVIDPPVLIGEVSAANPGICLVCGAPVEEEACHCRRCGTIHHMDCWKYIGGCAVFACPGRPGVTRQRPPIRAA